MISNEGPDWHNLVILTTTRDQTYWLLSHLHATNIPPNYNYDLKVGSEYDRVTISVNFLNLDDFKAFQRFAVSHKLGYKEPDYGDD